MAPCITGASESEPIRISTVISDMDSLSADVFAILHSVEPDHRHTLICSVYGFFVGGTAAHNRQHSAAGGHDVGHVRARIPSTCPCSGMKDQHILGVRRFLETGNRQPHS